MNSRVSPQDESLPLHQLQTPSSACQPLTSPHDTPEENALEVGKGLKNEELQPVLISALCTRHTQPKTRTGQRIRKGGIGMYVTKLRIKIHFTCPKCNIQMSYNRKRVCKNSAHIWGSGCPFH